MYSFIKKFKDEFNAKYQKQGFPFYSTSFITTLLLFHNSKLRGFVNNETSIKSNKLLNLFLMKKIQPIVPGKKDNKPVIVFEIKDFILNKRFDFLRLNMIYTKRPFTDVFLFGMHQKYELITLTEFKQDEANKILNFVDPYGLISYRVFTEDKKKFKPDNLNRDLKKLVIIETNTSKNTEFCKDFQKNIISLPKWNTSPDKTLLSLYSFFEKLSEKNPNDFRKIICSYKNTDFIKAFEKKEFQQYKLNNFLAFKNFIKFTEYREKQHENLINNFQRIKKDLDRQTLHYNISKTPLNPLNVLFNLIISRV